MAQTLPLRIVQESAVDFDRLAAVLTRQPGVLADEVGPDRTLVLKVSAEPTSHLSWPVPIDIDPARRSAGTVAVPLRWNAAPLSAVVPSFDGELRAGRSAGGTAMVLSGRYRPPPTWPDGRTRAAVSLGQPWFGDLLARLEQRLARILEGTAESNAAPGCRLCRWMSPPHHCHGLLVWRQGRLECELDGADCLYRAAHPLGNPRRPDGARGAA